MSMAKFNDEEIMSLQAGGNEVRNVHTSLVQNSLVYFIRFELFFYIFFQRAKQIYFKNWDPELNSYPETKYVYVLEFPFHAFLHKLETIRFCVFQQSSEA